VRIHPTAFVDPAAKLADDVEVGPWCLVGPGVELGPGCRLGARVILEGTVLSGAGNQFGHGSIIGSEPQDFAFKPGTPSRVTIGDQNTFREYVTIHRGTGENGETCIGSECYLMTGCHVGHNARLGNGVILANNCLVGGHATICDAFLGGGGTLFHQFITAGPYAMSRGGSRYSKDIPPYCTGDCTNRVVGINTIGLRRAGFSPADRTEIRRAFKLLFRSGLNVSQAMDEAGRHTWGPPAQAFFDFAKNSRRGLCEGRPGRGDDDES
jgi:UDP-N-acetylglucosamine acyltransferase